MSSDNTQSKKYNTRLALAKAANAVGKAVNAAGKAANAAGKAANATGKDEVIKNQEYKKNESSDEEDDDELESDDDDDEETEDEDDDEEDDDEETNDEEDDDYVASEDDGEVDEALTDKEYTKFLSELFPSKYMTERATAAAIEHKKSTGHKKCPSAPHKPRRRDDAFLDDDEFLVKGGKPKNPMKNYNISFIIGDQRQADGFDDYMTPTEALYDEEYSDESSEGEMNTKTDDGSTEIEAFTKMKGLFDTLSATDQENPVIKKMVDDIKKKEKRLLKKAELKTQKKKVENTKKLKTLLRERDVMNDLQYFNEKMTIAEQENALQQIEEIKKHNDITKPYRLTLLDADIPSQFKAIAYRKISSLRSMEPGGGDYYKMKNWVDTFMQIPFGKYKNLPITIADGVEKCHEFMDNAKQILDQAVYGLNDAKLQIMQMVGQWIVNPSAIGTAIAIKGPMGTGKTTLVKEGISKILGRDFVFIALGGATDSSFLEGHSYTYEGSTWGKIVDLLIKCKSMNPVIYFDELDKISDTPKGEEIAGILTHLTDTAQNNQFHDRYFSEIEFDLSRCLFIFSYNDESKVNKILLDRMYRIQTQGYNQEQKTTISNKYLLPKICEQVKFQSTDITIADETLHYIITNYTDKEDGVRTLKRCLEIIYTKLNLYRLMRPDTNIFESEMSIKVEFPMQVTTTIVDKLIKKVVDSGSWHNMYM
jgi:ATP-dependent Lon protease